MGIRTPSGTAQHSRIHGLAHSLRKKEHRWGGCQKARRQTPGIHCWTSLPASFPLPVSPGQSCKLQGALSWESPGQGAPPFLGGGSTQLLWQLWWPPPQETLQGSQGPHSVHAPATVKEKRGLLEILQGDRLCREGKAEPGSLSQPLGGQWLSR